MSKLLLMASMWVMIFIPLRAARANNALSGFKSIVVWSLAFNLVWAVVLLVLFASRVGDPQSLLPPNEP